MDAGPHVKVLVEPSAAPELEADLAKAMGQGLLDRKLSRADFTSLVDGSTGYNRFLSAVTRAGRQPGLDAVSAALLAQYEGGKLDQARDPESIAANIKLLSGDMQHVRFAQEHILQAGEYAVPQLFTTYFAGSDVALNAKAFAAEFGGK